MMYVDFEAGNKSYKLRLNTRAIVALEKQLGVNPLSIFGMDANEPKFPTVTEMVCVLFNSLTQYNHGITFNDAYDVFDAYLADGHSVTDFLAVIIEVYKVSGLMPKEAKEADEKNA